MSLENCKGKIYKYKESRFVRKSGAIVTTREFVPIKRLSCKGCEHCGNIVELVDDYIQCDEIVSDNYENGGLYKLMANSFRVGRYDEPDEWDYELYFSKKED